MFFSQIEIKVLVIRRLNGGSRYTCTYNFNNKPFLITVLKNYLLSCLFVNLRSIIITRVLLYVSQNKTLNPKNQENTAY